MLMQQTAIDANTEEPQVDNHKDEFHGEGERRTAHRSVLILRSSMKNCPTEFRLSLWDISYVFKSSAPFHNFGIE